MYKSLNNKSSPDTKEVTQQSVSWMNVATRTGQPGGVYDSAASCQSLVCPPLLYSARPCRTGLFNMSVWLLARLPWSFSVYHKSEKRDFGDQSVLYPVPPRAEHFPFFHFGFDTLIQKPLWIFKDLGERKIWCFVASWLELALSGLN